MRFGIWDSGFRVEGFGFMEGPRSGVWDLGVSIEGLEFQFPG